MKSSFLKIFAGHFQRYLEWLQCQKFQDKRKRQLSTRANHYLAYLSLSSSDHSKTFKTIEGKQKAWRNYRRFLKESMQYSDESLANAVVELKFFHDFVEAQNAAGPVHVTASAAALRSTGKVIHLERDTRGKRLSARPGDRQKPITRVAAKVSSNRVSSKGK